MLTVIIGNIIVGFMCVLSGAPGAKWHIGFPVIQRASWGTTAFIFVIIQRFFLACIWFSTQAYWGGKCFQAVITAIAPSFRQLNKPLANGTLTTGDITCFIVFTVLYLPFIWISPEKYKIPFLVSCVCIIPTVFALLAWFTATAGGGGAFLQDVSIIDGVDVATGSQLGWMMVLGICTNISSISVHIFIQSDYTRFARRPRDQVLAQLVMVPLGTIVVALIGIVCTSCAAQIFPEFEGTLLWEPYRLLDALQLHYNDSPGSRAAVFFAGFAFMVAQFGMVVANNGVAGGLDIASILPRYFTLRRGMLLLVAISFIVQPWQLMNGASKFLNVLGGYGVFLGPMTGVMYADYFFVHKRTFKLPDLYRNDPASIYYYWRGLNWRAPVAWLMGIWITLPGFARRVQGGEPLQGWSELYYISWPLGTTVSILTYILLNRLRPMPGTGPVDEDDMSYFEPDSSQEARVVYAADGNESPKYGDDLGRPKDGLKY